MSSLLVKHPDTRKISPNQINQKWTKKTTLPLRFIKKKFFYTKFSRQQWVIKYSALPFATYWVNIIPIATTDHNYAAGQNYFFFSFSLVNQQTTIFTFNTMCCRRSNNWSLNTGHYYLRALKWENMETCCVYRLFRCT